MPRKAVGCRIWPAGQRVQRGQRLRAGAENPSRRGRQTRGAAECRAKLPSTNTGAAGQRVQRGQRLRAGAENPSRRGRQTRGAAECRARLSGAASGPAGQRVQRGQRLRAGAENPSRRGRQTRGAAECRARLSVQNLALLANGFSGVSGCEPGLKILHAEVVKREAQLDAAQGCHIQTLALLQRVQRGQRLRAGAENPSRRGRQTRGAAEYCARLSVQQRLRLPAGTKNPSRRGRQTRGAAECRARLSGAQHLALLANGFSGVSGCEPGLKILYTEVSQRIPFELSNWSAKELTMILRVLCKCFPSVLQVTLGITLFNELYRLQGSRLETQLLWFSAMLDFVTTYNPHEFFFDAMPCRNCLPGELFFEAPGQTFSEPVFSPADSKTGWKNNQWQETFAFIYWYWPDPQQGDCPVLIPEQDPAVSRLQQKVYRALVKALPNQPIKMEVQIKQFPVDILVGQRLCIEVDGPSHFYRDDAIEEANKKSLGMRRTVDYFIDHILHKLGFKVMRIPYTQVDSPQELSNFVESVKRRVNQDR